MRKNTRYDEVLLHGNASERVLEVAGQIDADLLVIGAQHRTFADSTVIGSTTERIARFAKQPVLTVIRRLAPAGTPVEEDHRLHLV